MRTIEEIDAELQKLDEVVMKTRARMRECAREREDVLRQREVDRLVQELEAKTGGRVQVVAPAGIASAEQVNGVR